MKNILIPLVALGLGTVAGWAFRKTLNEKTRPAMTHVTTEVAVSEATKKSDEGLIDNVRLSPKEITLRLYDTWDEEQAERWLAKLSVEELREVIAIVATWPDQNLRVPLTLWAMDAWSKIDLEGVLEEVAKEDKFYHYDAKAWICGRIAATDPAEAFRIIGEGGQFTDTSTEWSVGYRWLKEDAAGALRYWDEHPESGTAVGCLADYGRDLPTPALAALTERVKALKSQELRKLAVEALIESWQERDPITAFRMVMDEGLAVDLDRVDAVSYLVAHDHAAALRMVEGLPKGEQRSKLLTQLVPNLSTMGYAEEALALVHRYPSEERFDELAKSLVSKNTSLDDFQKVWEQLPPKSRSMDVLRDTVNAWLWQNRHHDTIALAAEIDDDAPRRQIIAGIAAHWHAAEPTAAAAWVGEFPAGPDRDHALVGIASALARRDPSQALPLLDQISEPVALRQMRQQIARIWRQVDLQGLRGWLETQPGIGRIERAELMGGVSWQVFQSNSATPQTSPKACH